MALEKIFPRVFDPQSISEFSTVCRQALYEGNEEAKRYLKLVEVNYCSPMSTLGDNEKTYMQMYISTAFHLAKRMKKISRRNLIRKEKAEFEKAISLEETTINKNRYIKELEEIKKCEFKKTEDELKNKIKGIETRRKSIRKGLIIVTPTAIGASLYVSSEFLPREIAELVSSLVGLGTAASFYSLEKMEIKKVEKITDEYYRKRRKTIQDCCEDQNGMEKYHLGRTKQIEEKYSNELLKIEKDIYEQKRKQLVIEEEKLNSLYDKFISRDGVQISHDKIVIY